MPNVNRLAALHHLRNNSCSGTGSAKAYKEKVSKAIEPSKNFQIIKTTKYKRKEIAIEDQEKDQPI